MPFQFRNTRLEREKGCSILIDENHLKEKHKNNKNNQNTGKQKKRQNITRICRYLSLGRRRSGQIQAARPLLAWCCALRAKGSLAHDRVQQSGVGPMWSLLLLIVPLEVYATLGSKKSRKKRKSKPLGSQALLLYFPGDVVP